MNKTKIKNLVFLILVLTLSLCICIAAVACNHSEQLPEQDEEEETKSTETDTALIKNGSFNVYTGTSAPYTAGTWTVSSSKDSSYTTAGVIHVDDLYTTENVAKSWSGIANPNKANKDDTDSAVLMINNTTLNSYTVSNSFSTAIGACYKVTVDFKTVGGSQSFQGGAWVKFSGNVYKTFGPYTPNEDGSWSTLTFYIESSYTSTQSVKIALCLGNTTEDALGCVFFDNVVATKISKEDYNNFSTEDALNSKYSMLVPDGDFINNAGTANPSSSNTWTKATGKTDAGQSAVTTYVNSGIVNVSEYENWKNLVADSENESVVSPETPYQFISKKSMLDMYDYNLSSDNNILMISSFPAISHADSSDDPYTAVGYSSNSSMAIELGNYYELKVWVLTDLINYTYTAPETSEAGDADEIDFGAWIKVTGIGDDAVIKNINTNGEWKEYTIVIIGHEFRTKEINLELWLGQGGKGDPTLACGTAYFDNVRLIKKGAIVNRAELIEEYNNSAVLSDIYGTLVDVTSVNGESVADNNGISNPNFSEQTDGIPDDWNLSSVSDVKNKVSLGDDDTVPVSEADVIVKLFDTDKAQQEVEKAIKRDDYESVELYNAAVKEWWNNTYGINENPQAPYSSLNPVLMINNTVLTAYQFTLNNKIAITQNLHYRLAVWVKTAGIETGKGATVTLKKADNTSFAEFTAVNTETYENEITNDYVELVFYIEGSNLVSASGNDNKELSLVITMGTGNTYTPTSFISGAIFIANVNLEQVTHSEYSDANSNTGTYLKATSFTSSMGTVSNGSFNSITYDSDNVYTGEKEVEGVKEPSSGFQSDYLTPANWTKASSLSDTVESGVVNINSEAFINAKFGAGYQFYDAWASGVSIDKPVNFGAPNLLVIDAKQAIKAQLAYNSSSMSLTSNSYYIFKAYVRCKNGASNIKAQISLTTTGNSRPIYQTVSDNGGWNELVFVVETGSLSSTSVTFNIYVGDYNADKNIEENAPTYDGKIFVDSFTYYSIDKDAYTENTDLAIGNNASFVVDEFSTSSDSVKVSAPGKWTGAGAKSSSSIATTDKEQFAGIFTEAYGDNTLLKLVESKTVKDENGDETNTIETIEGSTLTKAQIFDSTGMVDTTVGDGVLLINNQVANYYNYKNSSSVTLDKDSYYKLSLYVRTAHIAKEQNAIVRVTTGSDAVKYEIPVNTEYVPIRDEQNNLTYTTAENGTKTLNVEKTETNSWQLLNFYFKTAESTSTSTVYLYLILGETEAKVQGYAFFDNVSLVKLADNTEFNDAYKQRYQVDDDGNALVGEDGQLVNAEGYEQFLLNNRIIRADDTPDDDEDDDDTDEPTEPEGQSNNYMWLYISSIVIAAIMIIVIAFYLIRKYIPKSWFKRKKKVDYSRTADDGKAKDTTKAVDEKHEDSFKD